MKASFHLKHRDAIVCGVLVVVTRSARLLQAASPSMPGCVALAPDRLSFAARPRASMAVVALPTATVPALCPCRPLPCQAPRRRSPSWKSVLAWGKTSGTPKIPRSPYRPKPSTHEKECLVIAQVKPSPQPPKAALLRVGQLAELLGISTRSVWRYISRGLLPQPLRFSKVCARWDSLAVAAALQKLTHAHRDGLDDHLDRKAQAAANGLSLNDFLDQQAQATAAG